MNKISKTRKFIAALVWIAAIFFCVWSVPKTSRENTPAKIGATPSDIGDKESLRVCFWNVKNYMDTYRFSNGARIKGPKPESEKLEIVRTLREISPDLLGVAEIGGMQNLMEFAQILRENGLHYPYYAISGDSPEHPQCAILSRVPFVSSAVVGKTPFDYTGEARVSPRGLTLASFEGWSFGVLHLKSRFGSRKADPEFSKFRVLECETILAEIGKETNLLIAGDFNDEPDDNAPQVFIRAGFRYVMPAQGSAKASYVWEKENRKYVFDFFLASKAISGRVSPAVILEINNSASDHAPVYLDLKRN